jgi:hypothetical protein
MDPQESSKDDIIIIISYATLEFEEDKNVQALDYFPNERQFFNIITISSKTNVILTLKDRQ